MRNCILLLFLALITSSCASYFKRKACESTNWFEHGKNVALSGKWLNADSHLAECRQVEAQISESQVDQGFKNGLQIYCSPDEAYRVGKLGDIYSNDLCEGPQSSVLRQRYKKGIQDYCAKSNGYDAGSSGKKYQNVCPSELEPAFLGEYKKGRKKYLQSALEIKAQSLNELKMDLRTQKMRVDMAQNNLDRAESRLTSLRSQSTLNSSNEHQNFLQSMIQEAEQDADTARSQLSSAKSEESRTSTKASNLEAEINEMKTELASLN